MAIFSIVGYRCPKSGKFVRRLGSFGVMRLDGRCCAATLRTDALAHMRREKGDAYAIYRGSLRHLPDDDQLNWWEVKS